nr:nucleoside diphosphate kinase regulator [uncultured Pseudomonas sp.]
MTNTPPIIITRLDLQRLERLLDSLEDSGSGVATSGAVALQAELDRAEVVGHDQVPAGVVTMNSRVHCREESSGKDYHLKLVYPQDAGGEGCVSILAPVGSALLGLSVGQHIDWKTPSGKILQLTLLAVEYQPEAAGEYNR